MGLRRAFGRTRRAATIVVPFALAALWHAAPAEAQSTRTLVSNYGQSGAVIGLDNRNILVQPFTTGANPSGYELSRVRLTVDRVSSAANAAVEIRELGPEGTDASNRPAPTFIGETVTLRNPSSVTAGADLWFAAPAGTVLKPDTTYAVVTRDNRESPENFDYAFTAKAVDNNLGETGAPGWNIADYLYQGYSNAASLHRLDLSSRPRVVRLAIEGFALAKPQISGVAQAGQTLEVSAGDFAFRNALGDATFLYQWIRVAADNTETEIPGATGRTYTLAPADAGGRVRARVRFTDAAGVVRSLESEAYPSVGTVQALMTACPAPALTGRAQLWSGSLTVGTIRNAADTVVSYGWSGAQGALDRPSFTFRGESYTIDEVARVLAPAPDGELLFSLTGSLSDAASSALVLHVCDRAYPLASGEAEYDAAGHDYRWSGQSLDWSTVSGRTLYLSADNTRPALVSAVANGGSLVLTYSEPLDPGSTPDGNAFSVSIDGAGSAAYGASVSGNAVTLSLRTQARFGETVAVSYDVPSSSPIRDVAGNEALPLANRTVTNSSPDVDTTLGALTVRDGNGNLIGFSPSFSPAVVQYGARVSHAVDSVTFVATASDQANATVAVSPGNGQPVSLEASRTPNSITVTVTNGAAQSVYNISLYRPPTDLCDRSVVARADILNAYTPSTIEFWRRLAEELEDRYPGLDLDVCDVVTPANLAIITTLNVNTLYGTDAGDYHGLSGLTFMKFSAQFNRFLDGNLLPALRLPTIPAGFFSAAGLSSLASIQIDSVGLTRIPADAFRNLPSLTSLDFRRNSGLEIESGAFSTNSNLRYLELGYNGMRGLPAGLFDGLTRLEFLTVHGNSLGRLPESIFQDLTSLTRIDANQASSDAFNPVADAGDDRIAAPGETVTLEGAVSGPWGTNVEYAWTQVDANGDPVDPPTVTLNDADTATPSFTAPSAVEILRFKLRVQAPVPAVLYGPRNDGHPGLEASIRNHRYAGEDVVQVSTDDVAPSVTITDVPSTSDAPFRATFTFSEAVTGFTVEDIAVGNGAASEFTETETGTTWTALITPAADGEVTVDVPADAATDETGNGNAAATRASSDYAAPNVAPVFADDALTRSVAENAGPGTNVGEPIPPAEDTEGDALSYTMEGADAGSFEFDATTRQIATKEDVDYDFEAKETYSVTIQVEDGRGETDTVEVTITLTDVEEPPDAPDAPVVTATSGSTTGLDVSWAAPANDGRPPITDYDLRHCAGSPSDCTADGDFTDGPEDETGTSAAIAGLDEGTLYQVQVRASNADGDSGWSESGGGSTDAVPTVTITGVPSTSDAPFRATFTFSEAVTGFTVEDIAVGNGAASEFTETETGTTWTALITPAADGEVTVDVPADAATDETGNGNAAATRASSDYAAANNPPTAQDSEVTTEEDTLYTFRKEDFGFDDADTGDTLESVRIVTLPATDRGELKLDGVAVTRDQAVLQDDIDLEHLTYTPPADANGTGYASFTFKVSDGTDESVGEYTMTINVNEVEDAPVLAEAIANQEATENEPFSFTVPAGAFADADGDVLEYTATLSNDDPLPDWLTFDAATRTFMGTPGAGDTGTLTVKVSASDRGGEASGEFDLVVRVQPGVSVTPTSLTLGEGETDSYAVTLKTRPAGQVTITPGSSDTDALTVSPASLTFTPSDWNTARTVSVTAAHDDDGADETVTISHVVSNYGGVTSAAAVTVTVTDDDAPAFGVCDRTPAVRDEILEEVDGVTDCADVTVAHLNGITGFLNLSGRSLNSLQSDDFADLSGVTVLWLSNNSLSDLPASVFAGLTSLRIVYLTNNELSSLPANIFNGLSSLEWIYLGGNASLRSLPEDIFDGLSSLYRLRFAGSGLVCLPRSLPWGRDDLNLDDNLNLPDCFGVNLSVTPTEVEEGNDGDTITVTATLIAGARRAAPGNTPGNTRVTISVESGTAIVGTDFDAVASFNISIPPGSVSRTRTFTLTATADAEEDDGETVAVRGTTSLSASSVPGTEVSEATVTIRDASTAPNAPPAFDDDALTRRVAENAGPGTNVGEPIPPATDGDGDPPTYTLEGVDEASFDFDASTRQIATKAGVDYDFEAKPSYAVTVKADDGQGGTDTVTVTIALTDLDEPPDAPDAPVVTATSGTTTSLDVSWAAPANDGRPPITDYDLRFCKGAPADCTADGDFIDGPPDRRGLSATIRGLLEGTRYQVQVRASNDEGDSGWSESGDGSTATPVNTPPTARDGEVTTAEDTPYAFAAADFNFEDADTGDTLDSVRIVTLPGSGELKLQDVAATQGQAVPQTEIDQGFLTYTPPADANGTGYASFTFRVSDGAAESDPANTMTVNVTPVPDAPVLANPIPDRMATVDQPFDFTIAEDAFTEADGDPLDYDVRLPDGDPLPAWLTFTAATRTFEGTPGAGDAGTLTVKVSITDGDGEASDEFDIVVSPPADATAPTVVSIVRQDPAASPTGADVLTWRVTFSEDVANVDPADFTVSGTTATLAVAEVTAATVYDVTVSGGNLARLDGTVTLGFAATQNITDTADTPNALTATTPSVTDERSYDLDNTAPTVTIGDVPLTSDAPFTATFAFSEAVTGFTVGDIAVGNGAASNFTSTVAGTEWTALITPAADGEVTVDVAENAAEDEAGNGNTAATQATSAYAAPNNAPTVANPIDDQSATEDEAFSFTVPAGAFEDIDGDTLDYSATLANDDPLPDWLTFTAGTREFTGTPGAGDTGTITVRVTATDGSDASIHDDFDIVVSEAPPSDNADLSALTLANAADDTNIALTPTFDSARTNYDADAGAASRITVAAATGDAGATVAYEDGGGNTLADADGNLANGHQVDLAPLAESVVKAVVTAEDGVTTKEYTVTVTRDAAATVSGVSVTSTAPRFREANGANVRDVYGAGEAIEFTVTFSDTVDVDIANGVPTLTFSMGSSGAPTVHKNAPYARGSGTNTLVFAYPVQAADADDNGIFLLNDTNVTGGALQLNGGVLSTGTNGVVSTAVSTRGARSGHKVDGSRSGPYVTSLEVTSTPMIMRTGETVADTYGVGETIEFTLTLSEAVTVTGTPHVQFSLGGTNSNADYARGSGSDELVFAYAVQDGDADDNGIFVQDGQDVSGNSAVVVESGEGIAAVDDSADADLVNPGRGTKSGHRVDGDAIAPTVLSIVRQQPKSEFLSFVSVSRVTWRVTFSEDVTNVDAADFSLSGATATLAVAEATASTVFDVTASGGDLANANLNSEVTLGFADTQNIKDLVGNRLSATEPSGDNESYTFDNIPPTVMITVPATSTGPFTATFTFSEPVNGFKFDESEPDSIIVTNGAASEFQGGNGDTVFTATITPAANGEVTVNVLGGVAEDAARNLSEAGSPVTSIYTAPNSAPTVANPIDDQTATVDEAFSFTVPDDAFADADTGDTLQYSAAKDDDTPLPDWLTFDAATRTFTGTPGAGDTGTLAVKVKAEDGDGETASDEFDIVVSPPPDTTAPTVLSIVRQDPADTPTNADSLTWRVTFSEDVANVDPADFTVSGSTATVTGVQAVSGETDVYDVTASGGDLAELDGTVTLGFADTQDIVDTATPPNALADTAPSVTDERSWVVDNTAPTVTIEDVPAASDAPFTATFTFSEPVTGFTLGDIAVTNGAASNLTGEDGDTTYTATITPAAEGAVTLDVAADVAEDAAGNGNLAAAPASSDYTAPNNPPTAENGEVDTPEDMPHTFTAEQFNFADADTGDELDSVKITALETEGDLELNGTDVALDQVIPRADIDGGRLVFTPAANANGTAYATFKFRVSDGTDDSVAEYTMTVNVDAVNDPATGAPAITGTARVDETLTADAGAIRDDADGLPAPSAFAWQWLRVGDPDDVEIPGATGTTYTLVKTDEGERFRVRLRFTDLDGHAEELTSEATLAVQASISSNEPPTAVSGTVTLPEDGSYAFKEADFGFDDDDADDTLASVRIVTLPGAGALTLDGAAVTEDQQVPAADLARLVYAPPANANGDPYTTFTFRVSDGTDESDDTYTMAIIVTAANDAPTVANQIADQTATAGTAFTFTVPAGAFEDIDGDALQYSAAKDDDTPLPDWLTFDAATRTFTGTPGSGNTGTLTVKVTASDGTLTADAGFDIVVSEAFVCTAPELTGRDVHWTATLTAAANPNNAGQVGYDAAPGGTTFGTLNPTTVTIGNAQFTVGKLIHEGSSFIQIVTDLTAEHVAAAKLHICDTELDFSGAIGLPNNEYLFSITGGPLFSAGNEVTVRISTPTPNSPATGAPAITGVAQAGQTLTAGQGDIADANGLPAAFPDDYTFQWIQVDGSDESDIASATSQTYEPVAGDVGKALKVKVSFQDSAGNDESLTSEATAAVIAAPTTCAMPDFGTRRQIWTGTVTVGQLVVLDVVTDPGFSDSAYGALDDTDFDIGADSYTINRVTVSSAASAATSTSSPGELVFSLTSALTDTAVAALQLHVCETAYAFSAATYEDSAFPSYVWDSVPDWSGETTRTLYLSLPENNAPTVANPIDDQAATVDEAFSFTVPDDAFEDVDGDTLQYSATQGDDTALPSWLTFDAGTGTFTGTPGAGDAGTLTVKVSITDGDGEASDEFDIVVSPPADTTAPKVLSIERHDPADSPTNADSLTWRVTFSEDVQNVDATDFTLTGTTAAPAVAEVTASTVYDVTASGGNLAGLDGTVTLGFASTQDIADTADTPNALADTAPSVTDERSWVVDNTAPTVTVSEVPDTTDGSFTATFTFSEAVYGFTVEDITVGNGAASDFTGGDGDTVFTARIAPAAEGEVTVDVAADAATDEAGNGNTAAEQASSTYAAPNNPPTVANGIADQAATAGTQFTFTVPDDAFEDVDGDTLLYSAAKGDDTPLPDWLTFDAAARTFRGTPGPGDTGTLVVKVTVRDGDGETASDEFDIVVSPPLDTTAPTVLSIERHDPADSPTNADALTWRVTFSEALRAGTVNAADFDLEGTTATLSIAEVMGETGVWDVTASDGDLADFEGTVTLSFASGQNITDAAGNGLENTEPAGTNENTYDVDNTAPTVDITVPETSDAPFTATFTFSEAVTGFTLADIAVTNGTASDFTGEDGDTTYTATITPTAAGEVTVNVIAEAAEDEAGNLSASGTAATSTYAPNNPPTARDGEVDTPEDTPHTFTAEQFNFADTDTGDELDSVKITALETAGDLELGGTDVALDQVIPRADIDGGRLVFTPAANANGAAYATFTFRVSDGTDDSVAEYTMTVNVDAVNDPATGAPAITGTARVDETLTADAGAIRDDADGLPAPSAFAWQWLRVGDPDDVEIPGATGTTYTLVKTDEGERFRVRLRFTDLDGHAEELTSEATLAVQASISSNEPPTAVSGTVTLPEDGSYAFKEADFGFDDDDADDTLASVRIVTLPGAGALTLDGAAVTEDQQVPAADLARLVYAPPADANADGRPYANFTFKVSDGTDESTDTYTMAINVTPENDAPTVANPIDDQAATVDEAFSFTVPDEAFADADTGDTLTYSATLDDASELPSWLTFNAATRTFTGTPGAGDTGTLAVKVTVRDGDGETASDEFDIVVSPPADTTAPKVLSIERHGPAASPTNADSLIWRVTFSEDVANVDPADFTVSGSTATVTGVQAVSGETDVYDVTASGGNLAGLDGTVTLGFASTQDIADTADTPNALADTAPSGTDERSWVVDNTAPTVTVSEVPDTTDGSFTATFTFSEAVYGFTVEDITVGNGAASDFTGGDGDTVFTARIAPAAEGEVTVDVAADAATDEAGNGNTAAEQASSTYAAPNNPPTAQDGMVTTEEDTPYPFTAGDFEFADTDPGDTLARVRITALETVGDLKLDGVDVTANQVVPKADIDAGRLVFTPAANANGTAYATFMFRVSDGDDESASAYTMTVDVNAVNDAPTVANPIPNQAATVDEAFSFTVPAGTFEDVDGDSLEHSATQGDDSALPSWLTFDAGTRTFTGTPGDGDTGTLAVKVKAEDGDGETASDEFDIVVNAAPNAAPAFDAAALTRSVAENAGPGTNVGAPVPAATDVDGDTLTYAMEGTDEASFDFDATTRQIATKAGVDYDFEAKAMYSVTITADDGKGGTDTVAVTISLTDVAEPPDAPEPPVVTATPGSTRSLDVSWSAPANTGKPDIASYDLRYCAGQAADCTTDSDFTDGPRDVTGTNAAIPGLAEGTAYQVQVRAGNDEGDGGWSDSGRGSTATPADTTAPKVLSIERHDPADSPTNADSLTWRVTFSEDVANVDPADFTVSGTTATLAVAEVTASTVYDVTASGGNLAGLDGTVTLGFASTQDIADTAGTPNALADTAPSGTDERSYDLDNSAPALVSARLQRTSLTLLYDEALDAGSVPAAGDYAVSVDGAAAAPAAVAVTGSQVVLTLGAAPAEDATVTVSYTVPATNPVRDLAGNAAAALSAQPVTQGQLRITGLTSGSDGERILVSNTGQTTDSTYDLGDFDNTQSIGQQFTTGPDAEGYILERIVVPTQAAMANMQMSLCRVAGGVVQSEECLFPAVSRQDGMDGSITGTPGGRTVLLPNTEYLVQLTAVEIGSTLLLLTDSDREDGNSLERWSIRDGTSTFTSAESLKMSINGYPVAWVEQRLANLEVSGGVREVTQAVPLTPAFSPEGETFDAGMIGNDRLTIMAATMDEAATVEILDGEDNVLEDMDPGNGYQVPLEVGENTIRVRVTARSGVETRIYTLTVTRPAETSLNDFLEKLVLRDADTSQVLYESPALGAGRLPGRIRLPWNTRQITVEPELGHSGAVWLALRPGATLTPISDADPDEEGYQFNTGYGESFFHLRVIALDGHTFRTYSVHLERAVHEGALCPVPDFAGQKRQHVWTGEVTAAGHEDDGDVLFHGYTKFRDLGSIENPTAFWNGKNYMVTGATVDTENLTTPGELRFVLENATDVRTDGTILDLIGAKAVLHVCDRAMPFRTDAGRGWSTAGQNGFKWGDAAMDWSGYTTRILHLSVPLPNRPGHGQPWIGGVAEVGQRLVAYPLNLRDADGVPGGDESFSYQWERSTQDGYVEIDGATEDRYVLTEEDMGQQVRALVSYTDRRGAMETVATAAYPEGGTVRARSTPTNEMTLSNFGQTAYSGPFSFGYDLSGPEPVLPPGVLAQAFNTGPATNGYRVDAIHVLVREEVEVTLKLCGTHTENRYAGGTIRHRAGTPTGECSAGFTAPTGPFVAGQPQRHETPGTPFRLSPNTRYVVVMTGPGRYEFDTAEAGRTDASSDPGWTMGGNFMIGRDGSWLQAGRGRSLRMAIEAAPAGAPQHAAPEVTGPPELSGAGPHGAWAPADRVTVTMGFSEPVDVVTEEGTPSVELTLGLTGKRRATYVSGSGTGSLIFAYTLARDDGTHTSMGVTPDSLALDGGAIRSSATGADADLAHEGAARVAFPSAPSEARRIWFENVPERHAGDDFTVDFRIHPAPAIEDLSFQDVRDNLFVVTGGELFKAKRIVAGTNGAWRLHLRPGE